MPDLVIYHGGCFDGFCSAWLTHQQFPDAEFVPCQYGEEPPDVTGKHVWILDFSFKRTILLAMKEKAKSLLVLDHHKTAEADLAGLDFCIFDMNKSGARLTWEYLSTMTARQAGLEGDNIDVPKSPWLVDFTEDRDLWRWKLPWSKEVNAAIRTYPMDFSMWDIWHEFSKDGNLSLLMQLENEGFAILRYQQKLIESHVSHAKEVELMGHKVLSVNCTCADLTSEVAGELAKNRPFGCCWFEGDDNERVYSLRSSEGGVDVSEIAKAHGGGGHRSAAGFRVAATGASGVFSQGQLNKDDEGEITLAVAADKKQNVVIIDFGKQVKWLGLPKEQAIQFSEFIRTNAQKL